MSLKHKQKEITKLCDEILIEFEKIRIEKMLRFVKDEGLKEIEEMELAPMIHFVVGLKFLDRYLANHSMVLNDERVIDKGLTDTYIKYVKTLLDQFNASLLKGHLKIKEKIKLLKKEYDVFPRSDANEN